MQLGQLEMPSPLSPRPPGPGASRWGPARRLLRNRWLRLGLAAALVLLVALPLALPWTGYRLTHSITDDIFVQTHVGRRGPTGPGHCRPYEGRCGPAGGG